MHTQNGNHYHARTMEVYLPVSRDDAVAYLTSVVLLADAGNYDRIITSQDDADYLALCIRKVMEKPNGFTRSS